MISPCRLYSRWTRDSSAGAKPNTVTQHSVPGAPPAPGVPGVRLADAGVKEAAAGDADGERRACIEGGPESRSDFVGGIRDGVRPCSGGG